MPRYPSLPGSDTPMTEPRTTGRSGVTSSRSIRVGRDSAMLRRFQLLAFSQRFFDRADHVERLLGDRVVLALDQLFEAADGVFELHVFPLEPRKLLRHEERLRHELLDLAGARHRELVFVRELVDAQDGDDVLKVIVFL